MRGFEFADPWLLQTPRSRTHVILLSHAEPSSDRSHGRGGRGDWPLYTGHGHPLLLLPGPSLRPALIGGTNSPRTRPAELRPDRHADTVTRRSRPQSRRFRAYLGPSRREPAGARRRTPRAVGGSEASVLLPGVFDRRRDSFRAGGSRPAGRV